MRLADLIKVSDVFSMNWVLNSRTAGLPEEESDHRFATPNGPNEWNPAVPPRRHGGNFERIEINWSVEALSNRAVDGEPGTPKWFSTRSSDQAVLHEGKNLEFLAHLTTETLFDGTLGPLK
jgi:hypothetical protein